MNIKWIKVSDSLPAPIAKYLHVITYSPNNGFVSTSYYDRDRQLFMNEPGGFNSEPEPGITHWAYLPGKPAE